MEISITAAEVVELKASGQVVFAYPRKGIIVVNGFKRFKADVQAIKAARTKFMSTCDKPLAIKGLTSYRYKGRYGWIMIGARTNEDALNEASRSTREMTLPANLQIWDGAKYVPVAA